MDVHYRSAQYQALRIHHFICEVGVIILMQ